MSLHLPLMKAILSLITLAGDWQEHKFDNFCYDAWILLHQEHLELDDINSLYHKYMREDVEELKHKVTSRLEKMMKKLESDI